MSARSFKEGSLKVKDSRQSLAGKCSLSILLKERRFLRRIGFRIRIEHRIDHWIIRQLGEEAERMHAWRSLPLEETKDNVYGRHQLECGFRGLSSHRDATEREVEGTVE